jgi:translocation and assembly module TamB
MDEPEADLIPARRWSKRRIFGAVFLLLLILLAFAWFQRQDLADRAIKSALDDAGVRAQYEIEDIGWRTQRLSNLIIGDPANPDLIARKVEIDLILGFGAPTVQAVRAEGVRLKGRFADGKLTLGELDKFRDLESKEPFVLPDFNLTLRDATFSLATPWGGVGLALAGSGNLKRNFNGNAVLRSRRLADKSCTASALRFDGRFAIKNSQPEIDGPLSAASLACPQQGLKLAGPALHGSFRLSDSFDRWVGDMGFAANNAQVGGLALNAPSGKVTFHGDAKRTEFALELAKSGFRNARAAVRQLSGGANGHLAIIDGQVTVSARGDAQLAGASVNGSILGGLQNVVRGTRTTPIGPVVAALDPALRGALRDFGGSLRYDLTVNSGRGTVIKLDGLDLAARSGATMQQVGTLSLSNSELQGPLAIRLAGGGLPSADLNLRAQGRGWAGNLALAPYAASGASLALPRLSFTGGTGAPWRFEGQAMISGPLLGGRIEGLSLPVDGVWAGNRFSMLSGCRAVRFTRLQTGSLTLPAQTVQACPDGGPMLQVDPSETRFVVRSPSLAGRGTLGSTPIGYSGANVRFDLDQGFSASNVSVELGQKDALTHFTMSGLEGRFAGDGLSGTLTNGAGQIGNVPLLLDEAKGSWNWRGETLSLDGSVRVLDAEQVDRFQSLIVPDMQVVLEKGIITAIGHLHEPETGVRVADADIRHELATSTGRALLAVDGLRFTDKFQPDLLTPLTLGAIANVKGSVSGDGRIEWDEAGVRSSGRFGTSAMDFAAAFGPVTGFSTDIIFTDLLGMESAPSQIARIGTVNPGVPAFDGKLRYRLLPDQKVSIEGGEWPFYGGTLVLRPTVLDFDIAAERKLTFELKALDAEKFLAGYEFENLKVSGVFDGVLPMVFNQDGGRIVGGELISRPGGGEVSYLGQLAYEDMGTMANFAFEALRSIRFQQMRIGVEGNIDGEIVTEVSFAGLQQGGGAKRNFITRQLAQIPIQFNVRIEAEFLQLIGSIRGLYDADYAAQQAKPFIEGLQPIPGGSSTKSKIDADATKEPTK